MRNFLKILTLFIVVTIIGFHSIISYSESKNSSNNRTKDFDSNSFVQDIIDRVKKDYVKEKTEEELSESAANGILSSLDPHSSYLSKDDFNEMKTQTKGEFGGLGIEVTMEYSLLKVIAAIEGTPADRAGIKSRDYISKIHGKTVVGLTLTEIVKKLRGKPGTKVNITILREGEKNPIDFVIKREIIKITAVRSSRKKDIAYIKINSFSQQAYVGVVKELKKLIKQIGRNKIRGLVIDLRGNPGGLLDQSIKISDLFLNKGNAIVSIRGRNKKNDKYYKDENPQELIAGVPIAVLINEGSASASEIVAGALQDHKRAIILGTKSFGKGSVQSIIPLKNEKGAIRMTTAIYYTPSGRSIQAEGIEPDIVVTEAKLEITGKKEGDIRFESTLDGHLENQITKAVKESKDQVDDDNLESYNEDYQLTRAIDLLRGISFYKKNDE